MITKTKTFIHPLTMDIIVEPNEYPIEEAVLDLHHIAYRGCKGIYRVVCFNARHANANYQSSMTSWKDEEIITCKECGTTMGFKEPQENI